MKKLLTCFFSIAICAPSAFAVGGAVSRVMPAEVDTAKTSTTGRLSGNVSRSTVRTPVAQNKEVSTAAANIRGTVSRVFSGNNTGTDGSSNRTNVVSRSGVTSRNLSTDSIQTERVATNSANASGRRKGVSVRPTVTAVGGRAEIGDTGMQTGSNIDTSIRKISGRAAKMTAESIEEAKNVLEQTASLNKSCQDQYNECMDQFCAVVDANQKRCSCSANISQYAKVEEAVKNANNQLNEVAQRIRYVGLSADEIRAIMNETEAEEALSGAADTSETRSMLDEIEELIRDPQSNTVSYASGTSFGLDLDLDFSSEASDIFSLDFLGNDTGGSFSNLRGAELYKAAKKRCSTVLNQCKSAGGTPAQITGNYDLAIDKDCVAYEQGLTKMNDTLLANVRSANLMLQKARLAVLQNKNQYDAKGCIAALNTCMTDDMVCGADYFKCVDPTKIYIDENGEVVLGQNISNITAFMEGYNNASINSEFLGDTEEISISGDFCKTGPYNDGRCVVKYLLSKIGTGDKVTDGGLCRAVLDKCQAYTYPNGVYNKYNDIVVNYIQRAMVNIRAAQQRIIADYAASCMLDIATCYNQQVSQLNSWTSTSSLSGIYNVMRGACRNVALTCSYAVFDSDPLSCPDNDVDKCISSISEMFYNSLLCPEGYVYRNGQCVSENKCLLSGGIWDEENEKCTCPEGYILDSTKSVCTLKDSCVFVRVYDSDSNSSYADLYVKNGTTVYNGKNCTGSIITSISVPIKSNAKYMGVYSNTDGNGNMCIDTKGKIYLNNCPITSRTHWYAKFECDSGYDLFDGKCVQQNTTVNMNIVDVSSLSKYITMKNNKFECSTVIDTNIQSMSNYIMIDMAAAEQDNVPAGCLKLCYDTVAGLPEDNAGQYCSKIPANKCIEGGNIYIVLDEYCAI